MPPARHITRSRKTSSPNERSINWTAALAWAVLFVFLVAIAVISWIGSFYIFGHPEEPLSYKVLSALKKIDPPRRFEVVNAPAGEFLTPQAALARFSGLSPSELKEANSVLLRNYIRNFQGAKGEIPYLTGDFTILDSFELTDKNVFSSGVVVLARANDEPLLLLEHVFTADEKNIPALHRTLLTGLDLKLRRRMDFSVIIHAEKLRDGRLKVTALPIIYGTYASTQSGGVFSLSPPEALNVEAGLPILSSTLVEQATNKYLSYRARAGLDDPSDNVPRAGTLNTLLRVQRPEAMPGATPAATPDEIAVARPEPTPEIPVAVAVPSATPMRVLPALPALPVEPVSTPAPSPTPLAPLLVPETAEIVVPVASPALETVASPTPAASPAPAIANVAGRDWPLYDPGRMPRGRLVAPRDMPRIAETGVAGERVYLQGSFVVTASGKDRAVLRSRGPAIAPFGGKPQNVRIIVDYPAGTEPPSEGASFSRDAARPFQITDISLAEDGQINVRVREITRP